MNIQITVEITYSTIGLLKSYKNMKTKDTKMYYNATYSFFINFNGEEIMNSSSIL